MSLGVDVSKLYTNMIMAASTTDPVQKKMVYSYLITYAQEKSDLALLCINTLQADCRDQEPMIRALALRSLCSLRMKNICEYALDPLRGLTNDRSSYVRRTALLAWVKLYSFQPNTIQDHEPQLLDNILSMVNDQDSQVVVNALHALQEILSAVVNNIEQQYIAKNNEDVNGDNPVEVDIPFGLNPDLLQERGVHYYINQNLMLALFNRFNTIPEWGQSYILELATHYVPADEEESFGILNILDPLLSHNNTAVVLSAIKLFIHLARYLPDLAEQVYDRIRTPLITALLVSPMELAYVVLSHIKVISIKAPHVFANDFRYFFIRYNDILSVKVLKLEILSLIATAETASFIIDELREYVYDADEEVTRSAVNGIGTIAILAPSALDQSIDILLQLLELKRDSLANYVAVVCADLLRKYPQKYPDIVPSFQMLLQDRDLTSLASGWSGYRGASSGHSNSTTAGASGQKVSAVFDSKNSASQDTTAICSIVWMLGEFGQDIKAAPYVLETLIDSLIEAVEEVKNAPVVPSDNGSKSLDVLDSKVMTIVTGDVQQHLLVACMKLVFKRPAEIQAMLGRLFDVLLSPDHSVGSGVEHLIDVPTKQQALIYYRMLASSVSETAKLFLTKPQQIAHHFWEFEALHDETSAQSSYLLTEFNTLSTIYFIPQSAFTKLHKGQVYKDEEEAAVQEAANTPQNDTTNNFNTSGTHHEVVHESPDVGGLQQDLVPAGPTPYTEYEMEPSDFQDLWGDAASNGLEEFQVDFEIGAHHIDMEAVEERMTQKHIYSVASGQEDDGRYKLYTYAIITEADESQIVFLLELLINPSTSACDATIKTNGDQDQVGALLNNILESF